MRVFFWQRLERPLPEEHAQAIADLKEDLEEVCLWEQMRIFEGAASAPDAPL